MRWLRSTERDTMHTLREVLVKAQEKVCRRLAPAVGNMHGMLRSMVKGETKKRLDIERIAEIKSATRVFLTLQGGSGTDDKNFRKAIAAGINIIHINTGCGSHGDVAWRVGWPNRKMKLSRTESCRLELLP
jgi:fructose/tagatose bisphosphate aldolase